MGRKVFRHRRQYLMWRSLLKTEVSGVMDGGMVEVHAWRRSTGVEIVSGCSYGSRRSREVVAGGTQC